MFLRYYDVLPILAQRVEAVVLEGPENWLPGLARESLDGGNRLLVEVGLGQAFPLRKTVEVTVGRWARRGSTAVLPLSWQAPSGPALLPTMNAEMEIVPLGSDRTQLALSANYTPPLNGIGKLADRALLHRVAEATVKDFVDRVAQRIQAAVD